LLPVQFHASGNAVDINPDQNPVRYGPGAENINNLPSNIAEIARKNGLIWGGNWTSLKDPMHFEFHPGTREPLSGLGRLPFAPNGVPGAGPRFGPPLTREQLAPIPAGRYPAPQSQSGSTSNVTVGDVHINTPATDTSGIVRDKTSPAIPMHAIESPARAVWISSVFLNTSGAIHLPSIRAA